MGKSPRRGTRADCHVFYITDLQRGALQGKKGSDKYLAGGMAFDKCSRSPSRASSLVHVKCREDLGIRSIESQTSVSETGSRSSGNLPRDQ